MNIANLLPQPTLNKALLLLFLSSPWESFTIFEPFLSFSAISPTISPFTEGFLAQCRVSSPFLGHLTSSGPSVKKFSYSPLVSSIFFGRFSDFGQALPRFFGSLIGFLSRLWAISFILDYLPVELRSSPSDFLAIGHFNFGHSLQWVS